MKDELKVLELYKNSSPQRVDTFKKKVQSNYNVESHTEKLDVDFEWLDIIEETIVYLDNILRNPNRFIINEEEVVKVEQARRITVDSIKHLARNTNLIQEINKKGEVKPSKILNINKDESYNTYENRFIYTLILDLRLFVEMRKRNLVTSSYYKNDKKCEYTGMTQVGNESISISLSMESRENDHDPAIRTKEGTIEQRIEKVENRITDLTSTQVFKTLAREHVARVIPPIKKTNLILKNTNFQYAMRLWNYIKNYNDDKNQKQKSNNNFKGDEFIKGMFDDTFLLNYLLIRSLGDQRKENNKQTKEQIEELTNSMITRIIELNADMPLEKLENIVGDRIAVIRYKREASISEVELKINGKLQAAIDKIMSFNFR